MTHYCKVSLSIATVAASAVIAAVDTGAYAAEGGIENDALAMAKAKSIVRHDCAPAVLCVARWAMRCAGSLRLWVYCTFLGTAK